MANVAVYNMEGKEVGSLSLIHIFCISDFVPHGDKLSDEPACHR